MIERDDYAEFERQLPFYVNGTLEAHARERLEAALATSPALRAAMSEEQRIQAQLVAGVQQGLAVSEAGLEPRASALHQRLVAPADRPAAAPTATSTPISLASALALFNPRRWHPAVAFSLVALIPLQGAIIASQTGKIAGLRDENFKLASGPCEDRPLAGSIQLELADSAKWQDVAALLDTENLSIANNGDFGVLTVRSGKQGEELKALLARLKASPLVASAEPAA